MQAPLSAGLAPSHHHRWSVRVVPPAETEPQGWYVEFVRRWRAYLELLACPKGSRPFSSVAAAQAARVRPAPTAMGDIASSSAAVSSSSVQARAPAAIPPRQKRRLSEPVEPPAGELRQTGKCKAANKKRQRPPEASQSGPSKQQRTAVSQLEHELQPGGPAQAAKRRHGRAVEGLPT